MNLQKWDFAWNSSVFSSRKWCKNRNLAISVVNEIIAHVNVGQQKRHTSVANTTKVIRISIRESEIYILMPSGKSVKDLGVQPERRAAILCLSNASREKGRRFIILAQKAPCARKRHIEKHEPPTRDTEIFKSINEPCLDELCCSPIERCGHACSIAEIMLKSSYWERTVKDKSAYLVFIMKKLLYSNRD